MQPDRKRGRPVEIDRHAVSLVALKLFERKGFDDVTMDEIAKTAEVSRSTLFRAFPTKADLVWEGLPLVGALEEQAIALQQTQASLKDVVEQLVLPTLTMLDDPDMAKVARRRLKLIAASPGLFGYPPVAEIHRLLALAIARGPSARHVPASLVAETFVATAMAAVLWWARREGELKAGQALRDALTALAEAV
jgi:AcrR family transcriptional regulator